MITYFALIGLNIRYMLFNIGQELLGSLTRTFYLLASMQKRGDGGVVLSLLSNMRGRWQVNYRIFSSVCFIPYGLDQIQRGFQSDKMNFISVVPMVIETVSGRS